MSSSRLRVICTLTIFIFSSCLSAQSITMKVKQPIYDFFNTLKNIDTAYIRCEATPKKFEPCNELIVNPDTHFPEVKISPF